MKFKSIERIDNSVKLLDQTLLPLEVSYLNIEDYREIIEAIKLLRIRGAPAIGIAAGYALALSACQTDRINLEQLQKVGDELKAARPTAVNLAWAVDRVLDSLSNANFRDSDAIRDMLWSEAEAIHDEDRAMCSAIGRNGAVLLRSGMTVLTHCHTGALATGGIGTAAGIVYTARDQGKEIKVYADETRPLLQGARLTAWEMMRESIDVTLICDNTAGMLIAKRKIDAILVGADRIALNGDTANKIGTCTLAIMANAYSVPFYVAAPSSTFDNKLESGEEFEIEERPSGEVTSFFGKRSAPEGVKVFSPAFDVTSGKLITSFVTDKGLLEVVDGKLTKAKQTIRDR